MTLPLCRSDFNVAAGIPRTLAVLDWPTATVAELGLRNVNLQPSKCSHHRTTRVYRDSCSFHWILSSENGHQRSPT